MNVFSWIGPSTPPLVPWGGVAKHDLCTVLDISCNFYRKIFVNWPPHHTDYDEGLLKYGFPYRSGHFIQFVAKRKEKKYLEKTPPPLIPPVRGEGLKNITLPNRSGHTMQFLTWHMAAKKST